MSAAAEILGRLEHFGIKLGLDTTRRILTELGEPQRAYPVVLVAGTNGKGSTAAFLQAMLRAAGYRTGFYSSPHLEEPSERLRLDGVAIAEDRLGGWLARVVAAGEARNRATPTYFEALTAAAFAHFAGEAAEIAVVEVGMGGRLDATNAAEPLLSVITPVALDHREYLGDTLAAIAAEKAGILRPGVAALSGVQLPEAAAAIAQAAARLGVPLETVGERLEIAAVRPRGWQGQTVELRAGGESWAAETRLLGPHQALNLQLAASAALQLAERGFARLDGAAIAAGAAACRWPGRLEAVDLPDGRRVVFDGAHNPAGVASVAGFLAQLGEPVDLLFGALADKDAADMLPRLLPHAAAITLTTPPSPRALDPRDLALLVPGSAARLEPEPAAALRAALAASRPGRPLLVCGSLYLVGDLRAELRRLHGVPPPLDRI